MDILNITQWMAFLLYIVVFIYSIITFTDVKSYDIPSHFKHLIQSALVAISVQSGIYVGLQFDWIVKGYSTAIGLLPDSLWLGHEILSGVFLFVIISIIRIGVRESKKCPNSY